MIIPESVNIYGNLGIWTSASISSAGVGSFQSIEVSPTGLRFPNDAFGGGGDTAGMRLVSRGGEAQSLEIYATNDATSDWVNLSVPSVNDAKVNGYTIWNHGNFEPSSKLDRVPTLITNLNANSFHDNGIYAGYSVANAPNSLWGILRVWSAPDDIGDQVWQEWRTASYGDQSVWKRGSYDFGATWTNWYRDWDSANFDPSTKSDVGHTHSILNITDRQTNYTDDNSDVGVAQMLRWKNYGDNHEIIDASMGTAPNGATISRTNPDNTWAETFPTLMGWNGSQTYGVRVDRSRYADNADKLGGLAPSNFLLKADGLGTTDQYEFTLESGDNTGGLCLNLRDDSDGSEYFVVRNNAGNESITVKSDRTVNIGYQNYSSIKPILEVGDGQYGLGASEGYLNLFSNSQVRVFSRSGSNDAILQGTVWHSGNLNVTASHLTGTSSNIQTQIDSISQSITRNVISVASNTLLLATGRHLSATIPANTISQTVPTQVKVVGKIGANYVGGTATIEIEIAGNNIFTHTLTASGQNEDDTFEIDFGIRYAGSSTMECFGLCKIDNIVLTTQTPKMRYISAFFTGIPTNSYVFDVKSTITGTAGASVTLTKVTKG